ncbi:RNA polymerase sigma factor [Erwiniaceae bacterium BAC15a-03b]|uniref:RNA polymerase sigma factor n=1 Tax=Winslowiella arboricola TaxID=2978220 RepID=A0A9J6PNV1_9GAMM|nr:RNA polymerase sigma factor [Winslowiella arboricola]MCU5773671.1 RNA polymerase sigma factor [Winslowiella arboricola]MCU5778430.1 RNA polymerase sigma factor [Winslowiella arboricola]
MITTITGATAEQRNPTEYSLSVDWDEVFNLHNKKLMNFIRKRIANPEDVEDVLQMTCLEVLRNRHKFMGASRPETWVFGIAVNLIRNYYKSQQSRYLLDTLDDEITADLLFDNDPSDITEQRQLLGATLNSIEKLPGDIRTMLSILVENEGSYQDVAQHLNIPIGTVRSRLSRAREALRVGVYA